MIYRQEGYVLKQIRGLYALLPFGQKIADHQKGITLNETGTFLWKSLSKPQSRETLVEKLALHYQADTDAHELLQRDVNNFLKQLLSMGILREDTRSVSQPFYGCMRLAGLSVHLYGLQEFFPENFIPFLTEVSTHADMTLEILPIVPVSRQNGRILLRNKEMTICQWEDGYMVQFPTMKNILEAYMTKDGSFVRFYCTPHTKNPESQEHLFHAFRLFFLYLAQRKGFYALHSASILYKGKAWLFSGHSGCGKSTHTALWHTYAYTPYLNGDLNLLGQDKDGNFQVYGIPWCGTSGLFTTETCPLGGIVLLEQAKTDFLKPLSEYEKILRVMQRMISPSWTETFLDCNLDFAQKLADCIPVYHLACTKNPSAMEVIKKQIDAEEV